MAIVDNQNKSTYLIFSLTIIVYLSFFLGFFFDENSAGAGGYSRDFSLNWNNLQIFLNNDFMTAVNSTDGTDANNNYRSSRAPLVYILHSLLNPFVETKIGFRTSVFCLSLIGPLLFYYCLREKFSEVNKNTLFFISSLILLSPYYRTSAYWALDENYGYIAFFLGFIFFNKFLSKQINDRLNDYLFIFIIALSSSACVYFDQKLIFIPLFFFIKIIFSKKPFEMKFAITFLFFLFSLPFLYLVILWGNIITNSVDYRGFGQGLYYQNLGFLFTMISLYFFPFLFFKNEKIFILVKEFLKSKTNLFFIIIFMIYIFYMIFFFDFSSAPLLGKGFIHKFSLILFKNPYYQKFFILFCFILSLFVILIFLEKTVFNFLIILYLGIISIVTLMFVQEYVDPLTFILIFLMFDTKIKINNKLVVTLFVYLAVFLTGSNIYYFNFYQ